jgi:hypothetical protein
MPSVFEIGRQDRRRAGTISELPSMPAANRNILAENPNARFQPDYNLVDMLAGVRDLARALCLVAFFLAAPSARSLPASSWAGVLRDASGNPVAHATIFLHPASCILHPASGNLDYSSETSPRGEFLFAHIAPGNYELRVTFAGKTWKAPELLLVKDAVALACGLALSAPEQTLRFPTAGESASPPASGGEHLSREEVSSLPLNERDFSKLLLLAAGTMTDTNGAANFTQQFAVNGQRGVASVFAVDGADTSDPELGGATFANFNVDAIQEVQSSSGVMPAEIGHGAASFTNVVTKSGAGQVHGSVFEFIRNAAFDARNFFDHQSDIDQGRFGTLGRNTFRGPGFRDFDMAVIKETSFGHRGNGELGILEFRAEFFNIFNGVNFSLPSNTVRGPGFGLISRTAGPSRQIQFSLKLVY